MPQSTDEAQVSDFPGQDYFSRALRPRVEIVAGVFEQGHIHSLSGTFGTGKSPMLTDITVCRVRGLEWCGRMVKQGPVILIDLETPADMYFKNMKNICARYGVLTPCVPEELDLYLLRDDPKQSRGTARLLECLASNDMGKKFGLIEAALRAKPDALVIIDPPDMMFPNLAKKDSPNVNWLYRNYRRLLSDFPEAAVLNTFNLKKDDTHARHAPDLLNDPRGWLEKVSGHLDLMNRSDVRLGMDRFGDREARLINGVIRGKEMHPLIIVPDEETQGEEIIQRGFKLAPPSLLSLSVLTPKQKEYWDKLEPTFSGSDAIKIMGKANWSRLKARLKSQGLIRKYDGHYEKVA